MSKNLSGMDVDRRTIMRHILQRWIRTNIKVAEVWEGRDVPWWYNERASLSIFAGAVWQCGGIAFEEFSQEKLFASRRGTRRIPYSGRCDIFFEIGSREFVAEAKPGWSGGTPNQDPAPRIRKRLLEARKATGRLAPNGQRRLAIVFVAPSFRKKFRIDEVRMIKRWVKNIRVIPCSAKAWVFPEVSRRLRSEDKRYWPGTAVFIQEVKRSIR
jgi:hypothetical protein